MDISKPEIVAVQAASVEVLDVVTELTNLELSLVGGGMGDISLG